jgi:hypothetical protein
MYTDSQGRNIPSTVDEFAPILVRSKLSTQEQAVDFVAKYHEQPKPGNLPDTLTAFCSFLVGEGLVTSWQCINLRNGQWKGFYLDHYLLLDKVYEDSKRRHYLARGTTDGAYVRLAISPSRGPEIHYEMVEKYYRNRRDSHPCDHNPRTATNRSTAHSAASGLIMWALKINSRTAKFTAAW